MKYPRLVFALTLLLVPILAVHAAAQGPPGGSPGGGPGGGPVADLELAVEELTSRVDVLESQVADLEVETADQDTRIADLEHELSLPARQVPTGTVIPFAGSLKEIPDGWLLCDGSEISRTKYADLFATIGIAHGPGDRKATFNLPDYRGTFLRGVDHGRGVDPDRGKRFNIKGGAVGDRVGSAQSSTFARHGHHLGAFGLCDAGTPNGGLFPVVNIFQHCRVRTASSASGGNETRPVNVYVNFLVKY